VRQPNCRVSQTRCSRGVLYVRWFDSQKPLRTRWSTTCNRRRRSDPLSGKQSGKLSQVDTIDAETDATMDVYIVPQHVIAVRIEKMGDLLGALAEGSPDTARVTESRHRYLEAGWPSRGTYGGLMPPRRGENATRLCSLMFPLACHSCKVRTVSVSQALD
jgi:hypothetical protein